MIEYDLKIEKEKRQISLKFNGHILMDTFEIFKDNPKLLGGYISTFKEKHSHEDLLNSSESEVKVKIQKHFKEWSSQLT